MTRQELIDFVVGYLDNKNPEFIAEMDTFIRTTEEDLADLPGVVLPSARAQSTFNCVPNQPHVFAPNGLRSVISLSLTQGSTPRFLREVQPDFIRTAYSGAAGIPTRYALEDATRILLGPVPDVAYTCDLWYERTPPSLVDSPAGTWLSEHCPQALRWGVLVQGYIWMKGDETTLARYKEMRGIAAGQLSVLVQGRRRRDDFRDGQSRQT